MSTDMSGTRKIGHPSEMLKKGEKIKCRILSLDRQRRRMSLKLIEPEKIRIDNLNNKKTARSIAQQCGSSIKCCGGEIRSMKMMAN